MTGYRVGFGAGDPRAIKVLRQVKMCLDTGTPNFIQDAAVAALGDESHVEALREEYRQKREILGEALCGLGLPDCRPEAAMYIWQRVPEGMSGIDFALLLLRQDVAVVTTPGEWIASPLASGENPGGGHVRMALVPTLEMTRLAAHRLQRLREALS
jgi:LL-diaminopimelate aminotransferase